MKKFLAIALVGLSGCYMQVRDERAVNVVGLGIFTALFVGNAIEESRDPRPMPSLSTLDPLFRAQPAPPLAPERVVHEQDCSKPIENPSANLRCR